MNKLQLIDAVKFNEMFEYLKSDRENKKLLQGIKKQDEFQLEEKGKAMDDAVKLKQKDRVGEIMVEFLKQKNAVKRKADSLVLTAQPEPEPEADIPDTPFKTIGERKIRDFLNKKGMKSSTLQMGKETVNRADLIYDLSHNASKQFMLNPSERTSALKFLKKKQMPASIIKNSVLRKQYSLKKYDTTTDNSSSSDSDFLLFKEPGEKKKK